MAVTIVIPGEMRGKGRPRFSTRGGFARAFTDDKTKNAEAWVRACAIDAGFFNGPLDCAIDLNVRIDVVPPASWSKTTKTRALSGAIFPTTKPDIDNVAKLLADALNGIVWRDDKQIVCMSIRKVYAERAQTVLEVRKAA